MTHLRDELMAEFLETRDADYGASSPSDLEALQVVKSWHRYPAIRKALSYRGLNLGELIEYHLIEDLIPILAEARAAAENERGR